jgi:hypothetical protein
VTLGVLMHEFGWAADDYDRLAAGQPGRPHHRMRLPGHRRPAHRLGRCPTGPNIGYPIVECHADGSFTCTKPAGTGGLVTPAVIAEQMLYEIGDPPATSCPTWSATSPPSVAQDGPEHRVECAARAAGPTTSYKVSATYMDGFR